MPKFVVLQGVRGMESLGKAGLDGVGGGSLASTALEVLQYTEKERQHRGIDRRHPQKF